MDSQQFQNLGFHSSVIEFRITETLLRKFSRNDFLEIFSRNVLIKNIFVLSKNCIPCYKFVGHLADEDNGENNEDLEGHFLGHEGGLPYIYMYC